MPNLNNMFLIQTQNLPKNETISKQVQQLDLDNIIITPQTNVPTGKNYVYQFRSGDYAFNWEQTEKGGAIEIYQSNKKVKEIDY